MRDGDTAGDEPLDILEGAEPDRRQRCGRRADRGGSFVLAFEVEGLKLAVNETHPKMSITLSGARRQGSKTPTI